MGEPFCLRRKMHETVLQAGVMPDKFMRTVSHCELFEGLGSRESLSPSWDSGSTFRFLVILVTFAGGGGQV